MNTKRNTSDPRGFTLIELLVVIAIIGILAGMILAGVVTVKAKAQVAKARAEVTAIAGAIADYTAGYGLPPVSKNVWDCSAKNAGNRDFTYGNTAANIKSYGSPSYTTDNAEIIAVLQNGGQTPALKNLAAALNSKKLVYLDAPTANNAINPGVGTDGVFRDPWGNPYIISVDLDSSGTVLDGFYGGLIKDKINPKVNPKYSQEITAPVIVWSFGPDGKVDANPDFTTPEGKAAVAKGPEAMLRYGDNKDNVLSWDK
jgi:prepilin-type N-terminal cleavage/methylation domain-containing protein